MRQMKDSGIEWIGEIPEGWEVRRLKTYLYNKDEKKEYSHQKYIGLENIESWTGKYTESSLHPEGMCNIFTKGDILFSKLRPYLAKCILARFDGLCSTEFLILSSYKQCNTFFKYLLLSPHIIDKINAATYGTKMPRANWEIIGSIKTPIPPLTEQQRIADYLDAKCAHIDQCQELTRQSMEKLHAYKLSCITEAVTKGLDPDVPLKDSGVPWIGQIPVGWEPVKIKFFSSIKSGDAIRAEDLLEAGQYDVYGGNGKIGTCSKYNCNGESFIIGRVGALCGNIHKLGTKAFISDNALILKINHNNFDFIYFSLVAANLGKLNTSNAQPLITATRINNVYLPLPPLPEQERIAAYLDKKCARIDALLEEKQALLDKLAEYKKSLIFECVTGKREVPSCWNR